MTGAEFSDRIATHLAQQWDERFNRFRNRTHGSIGTYNEGCRCGDCTRAARDHQRRMRANRKARQA